MNLHDALRKIAGYLDLEADVLISHAEQDTIGGWDYDAYKHNWPTGSIFGAEGQILYALVRAMDAQQIVELGTWAGCSASHMAQALDDAGEDGLLVCVDPGDNAGYLITIDRAALITFERRDRLDYLRDLPDNSVDLLFNDTPQDIESGGAIAREAQRVLYPGGVYIVHDAAHWLVGAEIQAGIAAGGITDHLTIKVDETDCGLAIWRKPGARPQAPKLFDKDHPAALANDGLIVANPKLVPSQAVEVEGQKYLVFNDITHEEFERASQESRSVTAPDYTDYTGWTVAELQFELDRRGIEYKSKDRKDDLIVKLTD